MLLNMILSDIHAGRSVLVIDPKADLVNDVLARIPDSRRDDVVVLDPSSSAPVGFNPLSFRGFRDKTLLADAILAAFREIFSDTFGIRSQDYFSAALLTLADMKGSNLLWLPPLLTDEHFRGKIVAQVKDEVALKPFWQQYEAMKESERRTQVETVLNKLRQLLFRPGLRNVLGQSKPKFDFADLFYERKIVLVPLNKSLIGAESARLLGSLIIGMTWTLALARADIPKEKRHIINVYIDELQDYLALPTDLADALAQARGLGVGITMAHQYRSQLTSQLKAGIDANARNKICFGLSGPDAKEMAAQASELTAQDFMNLPRYSIYANVQYHGRSTGWMMGKTLPPPPELRLPADLKAYSDQRYGVPAEETEAAYLKLLRANSHTDSDTQKPEPLIGRKPI